jgi:hypothetical protein
MGFIRSVYQRRTDKLSVLLWYTASYKPHGILWSLYFLSFFDIRLFINPMVSCAHCIVRYHGVYKKPYIKEGQTTQWPQDTMGFIRSVYQRRTGNTMTTRYHGVYKKRIIVCPSLIYVSYKPHGILWSLYCLSFFDIRLLINPMVSCGHCIFCPSLIYGFLSMTTRFHGVYKKPYIKEGQKIQWPQDTMGFIRSRISKNDRQYNDYKIPWGCIL